MNIKIRLQQFPKDRTALIWEDRRYSYGNILMAMQMFKNERWKPGALVSINSKSWLTNLAKMLRAADEDCILVPMVELRKPDLWNIDHPHYTTIRKRLVPGLVLFTSGSTGEPKVAVHDLRRLMRKWKIHEPQGWKANRPMVTLCFLGFDHIGGLNTIFHTLFNGGTIVIPSDRSVKTAVEAIERHKVQLLPTSPTFLRMMLANCESDIPSLELITYGTEPMPESTLNLVRERWPRIRCKQTYGMTELGILGTKSKDDGSLWMKVKETYRIADGKLEVKHDGSLVGYLNATCPITEDGYYQTGDCVESDGEYIRIIGRASEFINVGGEKVHPVEIENDLLKLDEIEDCLVQSESNLIMGEIIKATIKPAIEIDHKEMAKLVKGFLSSIAYPRWKIPQRIEIRNEPLHNSRHKKVRTCSNSKNLEEQTSN